ncbi:hypothetical protein [Arthrobacter sp. ISL-95]|uniref:hypothetical protein n=1 Tax=Arthrobacter sp. ISL-95 TaxID=2819116 RepID=UPI001BED25DF|nr:hypothetical protein [Arthrobacter sp. ISL-95]MBT2587904.1 hypothetical protein [Arthrobacter sp. ISL-95]
MSLSRKYSITGWSLLGVAIIGSAIARTTLGPKPDLPLNWYLVNMLTDAAMVLAFLYFGKSGGLRLAKKLAA